MTNKNNKFSYKLYRQALLSSIPVETGNLIITTDGLEVYADINGERKLISQSAEAIDDKLALKADKANTYTKAEVDAKFGTLFKYKGTVATYDDLPKSGNVIGDVWNVNDTGANYAWDGTNWDKLSETYDFSVFVTKTELEDLLDKLNEIIQEGTNE